MQADWSIQNFATFLKSAAYSSAIVIGNSQLGRAFILKVFFKPHETIFPPISFKNVYVTNMFPCIIQSSRQYFLDRILWCFAHLKSTINSAGDDVVLNSLEESNFVTSMDTLVDLIEPYSAFKKEEIANIAQFNAQVILTPQ